MTWEELDWAALDRLRAGFLEGATTQGAYWKSPRRPGQLRFHPREAHRLEMDHVLAS